MIYLDNAATSWPKPCSVVNEVENCLLNYCANPGRSGHDMALKSQKTIFECRMAAADFFDVNEPERIVFTSNATQALNIVIKGMLHSGSHAIITSMEHNSVLRPLAATGAAYDVMFADKFGYVNSDELEGLIRDNTSLIICTLSSNVCGSIQPFEKISDIAKKKNIPFLLDASQGAGTFDINLKNTDIDFVAMPGHKGLLGPTGTGILIVNSKSYPSSLVQGGTGSDSKLLVQPDFLPDRFESGTLNVVGIAGLLRGIEYVSQNREEIAERENKLCRTLADNLMALPGVTLWGYHPGRRRCAVLSFTVDGIDSVTLSWLLNTNYGIAVRGGYHCAYTAHCTLGSEKSGTVRASVGAFNTMDDIERLSIAVKEIALQKLNTSV